MKLDRIKLETAIASKGLNISDLKSVSSGAIYRALSGRDINTKTAYKIATELSVDVGEIVKRED